MPAAFVVGGLAVSNATRLRTFARI